MVSEEELKKMWSRIEILKVEIPDEEERLMDEEYRNAKKPILEIYYPLVISVAQRAKKKYHEVDIDDLISWGTDGLFRAVDLFDRTRKNKFETYAIPRIKGAIIDNIRKVDWVPRLVRQRSAKIQKAKQALESKLGTAPTDAQVAEYLNMPLDKYLEMESKANPVVCYSMNAGVRNSSNEEQDEVIQIESVVNEEESPVGSVLREEMFKKLMGRNFIPLERKIMHMHYYHNMTMKEIAEDIGYSESRVSQMHSKIIERLQKKVKLNPGYMKDLQAILHR